MSLRDNSAAQVIEEAESVIAAGRPEDAIQPLPAALSSDPKNAQLGSSLSLALLRSGQPAEALRSAQQAAKNAPEWEWPVRS